MGNPLFCTATQGLTRFSSLHYIPLVEYALDRQQEADAMEQAQLPRIIRNLQTRQKRGLNKLCSVITSMSLIYLPLALQASASDNLNGTQQATAVRGYVEKGHTDKPHADNTKTYQLYFATTRLNKGSAKSPDYSGERLLNGGIIEYGVAGLHEPEELLSPAKARDGKQYKRLLRSDADSWRKSKLSFVSKTDEESFFKHIREWNGLIAIYLHGYDKPFVEALDDACMVFADYQQYETSPQKKLLPIVFTWPSIGGRTEYGTDEANLEFSSVAFEQFIDRVLKEKNPNAHLDIVSHSMGGRLLLWYLNREMSWKAGPIFRNLYLCSCDIDFHTFELKKSLFENSVSNKVYVFVSDRDKALILSHYIHDHPRLGRPVDPPKFIRERNTFLTKSYIAQITTDTGDLLAGNSYTEPNDVKRWLHENPGLDCELGEKSRFIDVTELITKDFGHGPAFSVIAAYMAGQNNIPQLKAQVVHKRPDRASLLQNGGKPARLYRFLRFEPF